MSELSRGSMEEKAAEVYAVAERLFAKKPDWVTLFNKVMGTEGAAAAAFPEKEDLAMFKATQEYAAIQQMIAKLREKEIEQEKKKRPKQVTKMITVRLPESVHAALAVEAQKRQTSVNKLCISKLLQLIDNELVPEDKTAMLRGTAPGREAARERRRRAKSAMTEMQREPQ